MSSDENSQPIVRQQNSKSLEHSLRRKPESAISQLPFDILTLIFWETCENVTFQLQRQKWLGPGQPPDNIALGPLIALTEVCRFWRMAVLSFPLFWSRIPVLIESGRIVALANPTQVAYHIAHSSDVPLELIIGTRAQLAGPGVKDEEPDQRHSIDFLWKLAPRVTKLMLAFHFDSPLLTAFCRLSHNFAKLEDLTLVGAIQAQTLLHKAGFFRSPCLRKIAWAVAETVTASRLPCLLMEPFRDLTEFIIADDHYMVLSAAAVHAFLTASPALVAFQCRLGEAIQLDDTETEAEEQLPMLMHANLKSLGLTFQGGSRDFCTTPELLCALSCPALEGFSFKLEWSAGLDPTTITRWLCTDSHRHLVHFECLVPNIDTVQLLRAVIAMPLLQRLNCAGAATRGGRCGTRIDNRFLLGLSQPGGVQKATSAREPMQIGERVGPCPHLREVNFRFAYFSANGMDRFFRNRIYGNKKAVISGVRKNYPLERFRVDVLSEPNPDKIYKIRGMLRKWKKFHPLDVSIGSYIDEFNETIAGQAQPQAYLSFNPFGPT